MLDVVAILAGGRAERYGADKCALVIDGERLVERTARLARVHAPDARLIVMTAPSVRYDVPAEQFDTPMRQCDVDKLLCSREHWRGRVCLLFGDVWYSPFAIKTILADRSPETCCWHGRKGPGRGGKPWPELFGVAFRTVDGDGGPFEGACWEARQAFLRGQRSTCRGWDVYELMHARVPQLGFVEINDEGGLWAVRAVRDGKTIGAALVGHAARLYSSQDVLAVLRVAVIEGQPNACSALYGACSRAARAMGAEDLVTYTLPDEPGTSLRAAGWIDGGLTRGGEHDRPSRRRESAVHPGPKRRWFAPWGKRAVRIRAAQT